MPIAVGAQPVVADRLQRIAERRVRRCAARPGTARTAPRGCTRTPTLPSRPNANSAEQRTHDHALQSVRAAGDAVEAVGELVEDRRDAERHHQARQVGAAQHERAGDEAQHAGRERPDDEPDQRVGHHVLGEQRRRVAAGARGTPRGRATRCRRSRGSGRATRANSARIAISFHSAACRGNTNSASSAHAHTTVSHGRQRAACANGASGSGAAISGTASRARTGPAAARSGSRSSRSR